LGLVKISTQPTRRDHADFTGDNITMRIKANGITFNYQVDGAEGAPWLVFSNSLATNLSAWDEQARALGQSFRILRYDQRGHGETEAPEGRYTFELLIADAVALLDALSIARPHFAGLSMGGVTAMGMAQRHPDRVDRVIVCDSPCASTPASAQQWEERIALAREKGMAFVVADTIARWFPPETVAANPPYIDRVRQMIRSTPANGFIGCAAALANHDFRSTVGTVTRPLLFIVGEKDGTTPPVMRQMHEALAGSRFVQLPGAGHISNLDRPQEFNQAVREFLTAA
jgi:3-oxoadipate enol-lactonase